MKTTCYCIYCSKHPIYDKEEKLVAATGIRGQSVPNNFRDHGKKVECLTPLSNAFDELNLSPEELDWEQTAYADGGSYTEVDGRGYTIMAFCDNEDYLGEKI